MALPFWPKLTTKVKQFLSRFGTDIFIQKGLTIGHLLFKNSPDIAPKNVIYQIPCKDCDISYIGRTSRHLDYRVKEHRAEVEKKKSKKHPLYQHVTNSGHSIDFSGVNILDRSQHAPTLDAKEQFLIEITKGTVNKPDRPPHQSLSTCLRE